MPTAPVLAADTAPAASAPRHLGLRAVLILAALFEAAQALPNVPTLFGDMSEIPGPGFGGFLIKAYIASHAPLALAALLFAAIGSVRYAIIALGAVVMMTWLNYMPSVVRYGLGFDNLYTTLQGGGADHRLPADGRLRHRLCRARPAARGRHRAGQHSHLLVLARRDRFRDQRQHPRVLIDRSD